MDEDYLALVYTLFQDIFSAGANPSSAAMARAMLGLQKDDRVTVKA